MKRSPMPRSASAMKRTKALTQRSIKAKRAKVTAVERNGRKVTSTRSGGICEIDGHNPASECHHRKNRSQGGSWLPPNLLDLCHDCHHRATVNPALARERGWSVLSTQDPAEVPVFLAELGWVFLLEDGSTTQQETAA